MKLVWTEPAVLDLESIKNYITKDSEYYGLLFVERIFSAVEKIAIYPHIGREVPEYKSEGIREILYNNYRIIYGINDKEIIILAIVHGARQLDSIFPWDFTE